MSKPFDATSKDLLEFSPEEWPKLVGLAAGKVEIIDADISTVSGATDIVIRITSPRPALLSIDFQSGPDADAPSNRRAALYRGVLSGGTCATRRGEAHESVLRRCGFL